MSDFRMRVLECAEFIVEHHMEEKTDLGYGSVAANLAGLKFIAVMHHNQCQNMSELAVCTSYMLGDDYIKALAHNHRRDPTYRSTGAMSSKLSLKQVYEKGLQALARLQLRYLKEKPKLETIHELN
jgi:hypothetical protein